MRGWMSTRWRHARVDLCSGRRNVQWYLCDYESFGQLTCVQKAMITLPEYVPISPRSPSVRAVNARTCFPRWREHRGHWFLRELATCSSVMLTAPVCKTTRVPICFCWQQFQTVNACASSINMHDKRYLYCIPMFPVEVVKRLQET